MRKLHVTLTANICAECTEGANNSDHSSKQTEERRNHSDIGEISNAVIQSGSDPSSFCLGNFTGLLGIGGRIFGGDMENLLDHGREGFAVTIGSGRETT